MEKVAIFKTDFEPWLKVFRSLNEAQRRWYAGQKAIELGRGGSKAVQTITGLSPKTIRRGIEELLCRGDLEPFGRVRLPGGGRKQEKPNTTTSKLVRDLEKILEENTAGDPMCVLKWTVKSTRTLAEELIRQGHSVCPMTVCRLLHKMGYSLRANHKTIEPGSDHPDRDQQFQQINKGSSRITVGRLRSIRHAKAYRAMISGLSLLRKAVLISKYCHCRPISDPPTGKKGPTEGKGQQLNEKMGPRGNA